MNAASIFVFILRSNDAIDGSKIWAISSGIDLECRDPVQTLVRLIVVTYYNQMPSKVRHVSVPHLECPFM